MALDPRQLRAFLAITECGSLGLAAESLHLTQPALSRTIRRLETQLGVPLFERRTTGMELTMFGRALFPHANLLSTENALAVEDVLETALTNSVIDVAIGGPIQETEDIVQVAEHGFTDRYSVLSAVNHPLQAQGELSIHDVAGEPWVMPPAGAVPRRQFNDLTSRLGVEPPHIAVETRSPAFIKAMVAKSSCLGWLPEPLFAAEQAAGLVRALPVRELAMQRRFFVYRRRRNCTPPPVIRFLEALRSVEV